MVNLKRIKEDFSYSALISGLLAVVISYAGPLVIIFQASQVSHLPVNVMSSWVWAVSIGSGLLGIILSFRYKVPIITAWSTPGAALLVTSLTSMSLNEAIGVYICVGICTLIIGISGFFDKVIDIIPKGLASALLAGILLNFGLGIFKSLQSNFYLVIIMLVTYLISKRINARYSIAAVLVFGLFSSVIMGMTNFTGFHLSLVKPILIMPEFRLHSLISLGIPLLLVSLTGQFMPGMAVLRTSNFTVKSSPIISLSGAISILFSFLGSHGVNLAAITAAICTGEESHKDKDKRYIAGISSGFFYIVFGLFSSAIALLFSALPHQFIATLAGLALIGAILNGLVGVVTDTSNREASLITFLTTASGITFLGLGSAFWGLIFGYVAYFILKKK